MELTAEDLKKYISLAKPPADIEELLADI